MKSKIIILSDPHIGIKSSWKIDKSGVSLKTIDNINRFESIINSIDNDKSCLVIIAGDFFDHFNISMTIMDRVIKIIKKMGQKKIGCIIIGGNHDNTANFEKKERLDILNTLPNCLVFRSFSTVNFETGEIKGYYKAIYEIPQFNSWWEKNIFPHMKDVGIALLPFLSLRGITDIYYNDWIEQTSNKTRNKSVTRNDIEYFFSRVLIPEMYNDIENCSKRLLFGHYQLLGSRIHDNYNPEIIPRELIFSREMVHPEFWDLVGFGHIHLPQPVWGHDKNHDGLWKIQHIGSCDRLHFDERNEHKRYIIYDHVTGIAKDVTLDPDLNDSRPQVRYMFQEEITIPFGDPDPNKTVIDHILSKYSHDILSESNFKIIVIIHDEDRLKYDKAKIREELEKYVFYLDSIVTNIIRKNVEENFRKVKERTRIDFPSILDRFLESMDFNNLSIKEKVHTLSHDILSEAIRRDDRE